VRAKARRIFKSPLRDRDLRIDIFFYSNTGGKIQDADNASKPICDALQGIAYLNDDQVSDRRAKRRKLTGSYRINGADPKIVRRLQEGKEFVVIKLDKEGSDAELL
jgi:crossover junction endodeoxyribonuclease RusA